MKISKIKLCNYRAFYNAENEADHYEIDLHNHNLLIYGENGSGKSSLFKAVEDFFRSHKQEVQIEPNVFTMGHPNLPEPSIKISINDTEYDLNRLGSAITGNHDFDGGSYIFLSYRDILKTYLIDKDEERPNLFDFLINNLLSHIVGNVGHQDIRNKLVDIYEKVNTFERSYKDSIRGVNDADTKKRKIRFPKKLLAAKTG